MEIYSQVHGTRETINLDCLARTQTEPEVELQSLFYIVFWPPRKASVAWPSG